MCKYDWCLHKLFETPLLRNVEKVEVSKVFTITISMVLLKQNRQLPFLNCMHDDSQQLVDLTGHVTYRKLNHVWEHLNKWLLQRISLLFLPNYPQQIASVAMNRKKGSTWISGGIGRYMAVSDCRMSLTSSTIHRMVSGENLYLSYTFSSSRLSRVLLKSQNTQSRLIGIALSSATPTFENGSHFVMLENILKSTFCRLKCLRIKQFNNFYFAQLLYGGDWV